MNIILIGLKNSGKTTYGYRLSKEQGLNFVDTDQLILKEYNKRYKANISTLYDIYLELGNAKFRELEYSEIIKHSYLTKTVISTGGGSMLDKKNLDVLRDIGTVFYLYLSELEFKKRILSTAYTYLKRKNLTDIYRNRHNICKNIADYMIDVSNDDFDSTYNKIEDCILCQ